MKKLMLAFLVVLATAGTTSAEFIIEVVDEGSPAPGLTSYMVKVGGVLGFHEITIDGPVHQAFTWFYPPPPGTAFPTPTLGSTWGEGFVSTDVDTHLMIDADGKLGGLHVAQNPSNNFADNETCSSLNEIGIADAIYGSYFRFGMGTYTCSAYEGFATSSLLPAGTEFMQVVIPTGTSVYLNGVMQPTGGVHYQVHQLIGPEPSSIVILIVGSLCLLVVFFTKGKKS